MPGCRQRPEPAFCARPVLFGCAGFLNNPPALSPSGGVLTLLLTQRSERQAGGRQVAIDEERALVLESPDRIAGRGAAVGGVLGPGPSAGLALGLVALLDGAVADEAAGEVEG